MATATSSSAPPPPLSMDVRVRLSVMMFLQFAVWGAWFVVFFGYLLKMGFNGSEAGWIFGNMALGAILSPMLVGLLADRFISSEKLMAILHLAGAGLLYYQAQLGHASGFAIYFTVALVYALVYNPTLALSNSIAFTHVPDATRDFPGLRVWGTIGWIVVNAVGGLTLNLDSNQPLLLAAILSAVLGVFSLVLPATPPTGKPGEPLPFMRAFALFKDWSFAVFFVVSGLITVVLAFYYSNTASYLQQCDARMIPGVLQGAFQGTDTITIVESDPPEKGKKIERKSKSASPLNVQALSVTLTSKNADGTIRNVEAPERYVFPTPTQLVIELNTGEDGQAHGLKITTPEKVEVKSFDQKEVDEDGKKVKKWVASPPTPQGQPDDSKVFAEGTTYTRAEGETLTITLERAAINPATTMLWGQIAEMVLLPLLPLFLMRVGMKWVLIFGMLCWGLRYLLFAAGFPAGPFWAIFVGVLLHGICFDFFFAAGFIHVDNTAPKEIRASAQALFSLLTYGVGMWLGSVLSGYLNQAYTTNTLVPAVNWFRFWQVPAYGVIAAVIVFALLFRIEPKKQA